jgi:hypothetical protein
MSAKGIPRGIDATCDSRIRPKSEQKKWSGSMQVITQDMLSASKLRRLAVTGGLSSIAFWVLVAQFATHI